MPACDQLRHWQIPTALSVASLLLVAGATSVLGQSIRSVGAPVGASESAAYGVSGNGSAVAVNVDEFAGGGAYRWTQRGGLVPLGALPGADLTAANGISRDGSAIVGTSFFFSDESTRAWRWTARGGMQDLGVMPGGSAFFATSASHNASVVAGLAFIGDSLYGMRWTDQAGMQSLGSLGGGSFSMANAVSDDGFSIVGQADDANGLARGVLWTSQGGMQARPLLSADDEQANAFDVNQNGSVVVGFSGLRAVAWVRGIPHDLGTLPGDDNAIAYAVNGNGTTIGGYSFGGRNVRATLWTAATGMVDLNTYLPQLGIDLTGWELLYTRGVSVNGKTLVGEGMYLGQSRGWVVELSGSPERE